MLFILFHFVDLFRINIVEPLSKSFSYRIILLFNLWIFLKKTLGTSFYLGAAGCVIYVIATLLSLACVILGRLMPMSSEGGRSPRTWQRMDGGTKIWTKISLNFFSAKFLCEIFFNEIFCFGAIKVCKFFQIFLSNFFAPLFSPH